ncbi:MAG: CoA transferase subunit A [Pseudonocardia sp.]|nr:CoA transferase subunit A [Pseudonocardia sp.]
MATIVPLTDAVADLVRDGDVVAVEGTPALIPYAAAHEVIRLRRKDLTLVRMSVDVLGDQLVGAGCARRLVFSWAGGPGEGALHRIQDALGHGWPAPLEIEEHSHAGMAARYVAGASGLPFGVLRGYAGTDLPQYTASVRTVRCPFTGEELAAVSALNPDVAIVHARRADRSGNVLLDGPGGVCKEAVLAAHRSLVTVEEIVDDLGPATGATVLPSFAITAVAHAPGGAAPSGAAGPHDREDDSHRAWDEVSRDRARFGRWLEGIRTP